MDKEAKLTEIVNAAERKFQPYYNYSDYID